MAPPQSQFDISPEKEASQLRFLYRQFLAKTKEVDRDHVDLRGKTAIITGSNTGLGLETAHQLLDLGLSRLIMAVRNVPKAELARESLLRRHRPGSSSRAIAIDIWKLDLSSYRSVVELAERAKGLDRLDLAVLNAGLYKLKEEFNPQTGFDEDVQVNYLSNSLLMVLLLPILQRTTQPPAAPGGGGRLVLVSSDTACWAKFEERHARPLLGAFRQKTPGWSMGERYGTSKLLGQFFFRRLAARSGSGSGSGSAATPTLVAVNPGMCYGSELAREGDGSLAGRLFGVVQRVVGKPPRLGALAIVHAAVSFDHRAAHGQYVEDGLLRPMAPIHYKPEGDAISKQIWEETLAELEFARVRDIVQQMGI
ncbi:NAD(P)-binding protein [Apiospora saccharicola]